MKVTIAGSGCGIPTADRGSPCIAVDVGDELFAFDCGPGALKGMATAGVDWTKLDRIFVTHFHTDHVADIGPLLFAYNIPDLNRTAPLTLYGPPGMEQLYENLVKAYGDWLVPKRYDLRIEELSGEPISSDNSGGLDWRVETTPSEHSQPSFAYRLESGGSSMAYSGDTDYSEDVARFASQCDLLILECSYPNELEVQGHLAPRKATEMARLAGCKKLVLVHLYPICADYDLLSECRQTYDGDVVIAVDGMTFEPGE